MVFNRHTHTPFYVGYHLLIIIVHYAFYMKTIFIIWCGNEDEDEGEIDCHYGL